MIENGVAKEISRPERPGAPGRRPRSDGARTRRSILRRAAELASVEGLEGLSIGGLATALGMSKSGIYAHFGSKEALQLATIDEAAAIFRAVVIEPALHETTPHAQLQALCDHYLNHLRDRVFPGGCFFASAVLEMGTRPGRVRDQVRSFQLELFGLIATLVSRAQADGHLPGEDHRALAFEINGQFLAASAAFVLNDDAAVLDLAGSILRRRLS